MSQLFTPWRLGTLDLPNRIVIAPMCEYSANDGNATDWHMIHLGHLALSGAGLMVLEATAVSPEGRISPRDLGLYSDANEAALARVLAAIRAYSPVKVAVQLGHAGRKASTRVPWEGGAQIPPNAPSGWQTQAPSALPHNDGENPPTALNTAGLLRIREHFVAAARRAAFPADRPVWVRVSASDWVDGGWDVESTIAFAKALKQRGCPAIHVSSGGLSPRQQIKLEPGYQVAFSRRVRHEAEIATIAVGLITEPEQAEAIVASGDADAIALARAILYDPRWPWHAAAKLGQQIIAPNQYLRSQPHEHPRLFRTA